MMCLENSYPGAAGFQSTTAVSSSCPILHFSSEFLISKVDEEASCGLSGQSVHFTSLLHTRTKPISFKIFPSWGRVHIQTTC